MGLKSESHPTNSRSQKQNPRDFKIKQIIETTRCTHAEAEDALNENNQELEAAVTWVLDHMGDSVWTETKTRKTKKVEVVEERPARGDNGNRRGGKRGGLPNKGATDRAVDENGRPARNKKMNNRNEQPAKSTPSVAPSTTPSSFVTGPTAASIVSGTTAASVVSGITAPVSGTNGLVSGAPAPAVVKPPVVIKTAAGPLSFAAACAAGGKKPQPPAPVVAPSAPKPSSPVSTPVKPVQSSQPATPSTAKEQSPALDDTPKPSSSISKLASDSTTSESTSAKGQPDDAKVTTLTSQLKNDLGLSGSLTPKSPAAPSTSTPTKISTPPSAAQSTAPAKSRGTVEFVDELNTNRTSSDYHFGFNPATSAEDSAFKSSNGPATVHSDYLMHEPDVYKNSSIEPSVPSAKPVASAVFQMSNSYGVQPQQNQSQPPASPVQQQSQQQSSRRALGYAETSSVVYQPESRSNAASTTTPAAQSTTAASASGNYSKPAVTAQSSYPQQPHMQQPMHQQHTTQQQMYNPAMYNSYPYLNLYSPVAGRAEDTPYAPAYHMPYYGMDLTQMMPHMSMPAAVPGYHQQQQPTHRADHHQNFNDNMKQTYGQTGANNPNAAVNPSGQRDANMSSTNVPPPPGFSGPPANHIMNHFYRMNIGAAQPTPPPAQGAYGQQNSYGGNGQMNSVLNTKKTYHGTQWNN